MPVSVKVTGVADLQARLRALQGAGEPIGHEWAGSASDAARRMVPVRTGALRASIRPGRSTATGAEVEGSVVGILVDAGTKRHAIDRGDRVLAFKDGPRTVFARKVAHPGSRPQPFRVRSAVAGLRDVHLAQMIIDRWNRAR